MTKIDTFQLQKAIPQEEFDYALLSSALSEYVGTRQKINELLKSGVITRVKKGLYVYGPGYNRAPICKELLANLIYGPSCISLEYALAYHGLIPERVETITSVTPKRDKQFKTPLGRFTYRYLGADKYPHGITQVWIDDKHPILMASKEKALCDCVLLNKVTGIKISEDAKNYLEFDLRVDPANWRQFDHATLWKLNKFYRNKSIDCLLEIL
jgi:predicted transcriptional regulator of viral defense system